MPTDRAGPAALREYALLADGERGALVGPHGDLAWMCAPRWDSAPVFSELLGGAGAYVIRPSDPWYVCAGRYEPGTLIWRSRWVTSQGVIECREALAFPGDPGTAVLLRRVEAVDGPAEVRVRLDVGADFASVPLEGLAVEDGVWSARAGPLHVRWSGATAAGPGREGTLAVPAGGSHDLVLELSGSPLGRRLPSADRAWEATEHQWRRSAPAFDAVLGERDARQSHAVLLGLTSASGGMAAAATTSLPERAKGGRNYDYRYAWIRDQCYAGQAAAAAGSYSLLDKAVDFIASRVLEDGPTLRPAYTVTGGRVPDERCVTGITGYPGGGRRVGNHVNRQFQLDALGEALLLFAAAARCGRLEAQGWRAVEAAVSAIEERWQSAEAGVWELDPRRWTHSRLVCAAGLRAVAEDGEAGARAAGWAALADTLVADASRNCVHPSGRWQRSAGDPRVDAALLLPAIRGAVPAHDPRTVGTLEGVHRELTQDGYVYRFRHDERPLGEAEGAFLLCGFLTSLATHQQGRTAEACRWFERTRAACGPPGLYSEEYDVARRQLRGNLPQAFVHALLLETGTRLARPWGEG
ncbi:glycoside hydrolase family 15 protein [Streptomyces xiaopingdaonensis]|uniref:glycoside hydrolase family 15 protein n=1 Tax=Streptomyces xiaopingdaonensis TaxID=1565415 RepID=UPI0002D353DA|nr:glycoside hydrolase family 15 protein [Streptomyces xiaopingdaonensis]